MRTSITRSLPLLILSLGVGAFTGCAFEGGSAEWSDPGRYGGSDAGAAPGPWGAPPMDEAETPTSEGDAYEAAKAKQIPRTLRDATATLKRSKMLREAFGSGVIDHYVRAAEVELEDFDRVVTDYEIARGFEKA